jgi:anti-anti-sigma factor
MNTGESGRPTIEDLLRENARLREQIETINRAHSDRARMLQLVLNTIPQAVFWKDRNSTYLGCNQRFARDAGVPEDIDIIGKSDHDLVWKSNAEQFRNDDRQVMNGERVLINYEYPQDRAGVEHWVRTSKIPITDEDGSVVGVLGMYEDITERRRNEIEKTQLQEEVIRMQNAAIAELSTPLIPISDTIVVLPLIGSIDSRRAQQVLESLLTGVAERAAELVILDITGVSVVDTQVADALLRAARAVKLLGAEVVLTGISPEIAQTLVGLGADLSGIATRSTLQDGIARAMRHA